MTSLTNISAQPCRWHAYNTVDELEQAAVQTILLAARQAIDLRGAFHIVLAGGTTPRKVYESLRGANAEWASWHVYFGDERCLPPDHAERNSHMAALAWLDHVAIPREQIHLIPAERGAEIAASSYAQTLAGIGLFDLVLLGLGEDGHTASLFPGHELGNAPDGHGEDAAPDNETHYARPPEGEVGHVSLRESPVNAPATIAVFDSPKPPPERVSLSAHRLSAARQVMFLVTGEGKRQAVKVWRKGGAIPAAAIAPASGADVYLEAALLENQALQGGTLAAPPDGFRVLS